MTQAARESAAKAPLDAKGLARRLSEVFTWAALPLLALSALNAFGAWTISDVFFWRQDAPVLLATLILLALVARFMPAAAASRTGDLMPARPGRIVAVAALSCLLVAWAGSRLVYEGYALSMDEYMARFDAGIFASGRLFGEIPQAWRDYRHALHTFYPLETPSSAFWSSSYLPVNAAMRAATQHIGLQELLNPAWVAVAIAATYRVARQLWPETRETALVAAILLASSSQVLLNGMTSYAMPAHLALNLLWLGCFLKNRPFYHVLALLIGAAASGLHQLIFHPLFVAPFILQLWVSRRWRLAAVYTCANAVIAVGWMFYWELAFSWAGLGEAASSNMFTAGGFVARTIALVRNFELSGAILMGQNLLRFTSWQNPLGISLAILACAPALRAGGAVRALCLGAFLAILALFLLLPFQGHGWGYRYLHGFAATFSLLGGWTWTRLTAPMHSAERRRAQQLLWSVCALSVTVLLGARTLQAHQWVDPYARASRAITTAKAEVVLIDEQGVWYGPDLVRNDPFLRNSPITLRLSALSLEQFSAVCRTRKTMKFNALSAAQFGIKTIPASPYLENKIREFDEISAKLHCRFELITPPPE